MLYYIYLILYGLLLYFVGILINYLNYTVFESQLFITLLSFFGFINSHFYMIFDTNHPYHTLKKIYNLSKKDKLLLYFNSIPFYKLLILCYVYLDPIIIQYISTLRIILSIILSIIISKKKYLYNLFIFINIIINIFGCFIPFIFNDDFTIKTYNINYIGLIIGFSSIILSSLMNILCENINLNNMSIEIKFEYITISIFTFMIVDIIFSSIILLIISFYYTLSNKILEISLYSFLISFIYAPIYILCTKSYIATTAIDNGIIVNIQFILTIIISCALQISKFKYLYIPSVIMVLFSSLFIIYKNNKLKIINSII